jgi:hypothetical protein
MQITDTRAGAKAPVTSSALRIGKARLSAF